jgi:hypothetical protein
VATSVFIITLPIAAVIVMKEIVDFSCISCLPFTVQEEVGEGRRRKKRRSTRRRRSKRRRSMRRSRRTNSNEGRISQLSVI